MSGNRCVPPHDLFAELFDSENGLGEIYVDRDHEHRDEKPRLNRATLKRPDKHTGFDLTTGPGERINMRNNQSIFLALLRSSRLFP